MKDQSFVVVPKRVLYDPRLSLEAKGVFTTALYVANEQKEFSLQDVGANLNNTEDVLRSALRELEDLHYIQYAQGGYTICPDPAQKG